jgi:hypothetical protein
VAGGAIGSLGGRAGVVFAAGACPKGRRFAALAGVQKTVKDASNDNNAATRDNGADRGGYGAIVETPS